MKTIIEEMEENEADNINLLAPLKEEILRLVYLDDNCLLAKTENVYISYLRNDDGADTVLKHLKSSKDILCVNGFDSRLIKQSGRWMEDFHDYNYVYPKKEPLSYELPEGTAIRKLTLQDLDYVFNHYETVQDRIFLKDRIKHGMYGIVAERKLRGFVGWHPEGSIGILFVEDLCKRQHFGSALEAAMINDMLAQDWIPFVQVDVHNVASRRLQESLGLIIGKRPVHWYF